MQKQKPIIAALALALLSGAAPARAGDGAGIAIGLGVMLLEQAIKADSRKGGQQSRRQPGKGDVLIGRVGENEPVSRNNSARARDKIPPAATVATASAALPEAGPVIEFRPSDAEVANLIARPIPSDENVGLVSATETDGLSNEITNVVERVDGNQSVVADYGTVWNRTKTVGSVFDERSEYWLDAPADVIAKIDTATSGGMKRSEAIAANTEMAAPGKTKAQAATELAEREASERRLDEAEARAKAEQQMEAKRVADVRAEKENVRRLAEAEAEAKLKAESERLKVEAAYPALAGKTDVAPTVQDGDVRNVVDNTAKTSSVTDLEPVEKLPTKSANSNLDL